MHSPETWIFIGICVLITGAIALLVIKTNPRCSAVIQRWQQRRTVHWLKRQIPTQLEREKEELAKLWKDNPAAHCAAVFGRFKPFARVLQTGGRRMIILWPPRDANSEEFADEVDHAITVASSLFEQNFMPHYADLYANRLVVCTTQLAEELAAHYPDNAALILQRLVQNDTEICKCFNESVRDALAEGQTDREEIRACIKQLTANSDRYRKLLTPGFFRKYGSILFGGGAALALHELLPDLIKGPWIELQTGKVAARIFASFKTRGDQEFAASFAKTLAVELPALCERMDARVGQDLSAVVDGYIEHEFKHQRAILDLLLELSQTGCDLESGICWFKNASKVGSIATLQSWSQSLATAAVVVFIAAICAIWFYSRLETKAPAIAGSPEQQQVPAMEERSQMDIEVTLTPIGTITSADQSTPVPAVVMTPVTPKPPEYLASRADTVEKKRRQIEPSIEHYNRLHLMPISIRSRAMLDRPGCTTAHILAALTIYAAFESVDWFGTQLLANCSADLGERSNQIHSAVNLHTGRKPTSGALDHSRPSIATNFSDPNRDSKHSTSETINSAVGLC